MYVGVLREVPKLYKYEEENVKLCVRITAYTSLVYHIYDVPIADPMAQIFSNLATLATLEPWKCLLTSVRPAMFMFRQGHLILLGQYIICI